MQHVDRRVDDRVADDAPFERAETQLGREDIALPADDELANDDVERRSVANGKSIVDRGDAAPAQSVVGGDQRNQRQQVVGGVADRSCRDQEQPRRDGAAGQGAPALRAAVAEGVRLVDDD